MEADYLLLQRTVTVLLNGALCVLVGSGATLLWLRSARSSWALALLPRLHKLLQAGVGVALAAHAALLWAEAASMAEVPLAEALPAVRSVLTATHFGLAWTIGAGALLVTAAASVAGTGTRAGRFATPLRIAAIGILLYSRSMVSHAGAGGDFTWAVLADWLHLVLASVWVGEVVVAGLLVLRRPPGDAASRADCAAYVEALSRSATIALAGIFVTGAIGAWRVLDSARDLVGNPYGAALLVKVGLVLCAAALGGFNRFFAMPALLGSLRRPAPGGQEESSRFARVLQAEAVVLAAVLLAAAVLTSTPPPAAY